MKLFRWGGALKNFNSVVNWDEFMSVLSSVGHVMRNAPMPIRPFGNSNFFACSFQGVWCVCCKKPRLGRVEALSRSSHTQTQKRNYFSQCWILRDHRDAKRVSFFSSYKQKARNSRKFVHYAASDKSGLLPCSWKWLKTSQSSLHVL